MIDKQLPTPFLLPGMVEKDLDVLFNNFFGEIFNEAKPKAIYPPMRLWRDSENKKDIMEVAIVGFEKDEIEVKLENGFLVISGTRKNKEPERNYIVRTLSMKNFKNKFKIVKDIEKINVSMNNGLLQIEIFEKKPEKTDIEINFN